MTFETSLTADETTLFTDTMIGIDELDLTSDRRELFISLLLYSISKSDIPLEESHLRIDESIICVEDLLELLHAVKKDLPHV